MSEQYESHLLIELLLAEPTEKKLANKIPAILVLLGDFLNQISPGRRFTDLSAELSGSKDGLVCTFSVVPAAQPYLEACHAALGSSELAIKIIHEKDQWVKDLNELPIDLLSQSVMQASNATVRFRAKALLAGATTAQEQRLSKELLKRLKTCTKSKLVGHVETDRFQLPLAGFDGYTWSRPKKIRAFPTRERYGASLTLLGELSLELLDKKKSRIQLHYSDVFDADQLQIDKACKTGSQIEAIVQIAQQQGRPSMARLQELIPSGNKATSGDL